MVDEDAPLDTHGRRMVEALLRTFEEALNNDTIVFPSWQRIIQIYAKPHGPFELDFLEYIRRKVYRVALRIEQDRAQEREFEKQLDQAGGELYIFEKNDYGDTYVDHYVKPKEKPARHGIPIGTKHEICWITGERISTSPTKPLKSGAPGANSKTR